MDATGSQVLPTMDKTKQKSKSNYMDILSKGDIPHEHCYVKISNKKISYHLMDHNYFRRTKPSKKPVQQRKRGIKITELRAVYNCTACGYRTMKQELFSQHMCPKKSLQFIPCTKCEINNTPDGYAKCPKCSYFTKNKSSLKVHLRIHQKGTPYKCTECAYSGKDLKELIKHYDDIKDLTCDCGYTTHVKQQMVAHRRSHSGERPFSCGICSYSTADRAGLQRHLKKHESE